MKPDPSPRAGVSRGWGWAPGRPGMPKRRKNSKNGSSGLICGPAPLSSLSSSAAASPRICMARASPTTLMFTTAGALARVMAAKSGMATVGTEAGAVGATAAATVAAGVARASWCKPVTRPAPAAPMAPAATRARTRRRGVESRVSVSMAVPFSPTGMPVLRWTAVFPPRLKSDLSHGFNPRLQAWHREHHPRHAVDRPCRKHERSGCAARSCAPHLGACLTRPCSATGPARAAYSSSSTFSGGRHSAAPLGVTTMGRFSSAGWAATAWMICTSLTPGWSRPSSW